MIADQVLLATADSPVEEAVTTAVDSHARLTVLPTIETLDRLHDQAVDILIITDGLAASDPLDLIREIRREFPTLPMTFISEADSGVLASEALAAGVDDYVPLSVVSSQPERLRSGLNRAVQARSLSDPSDELAALHTATREMIAADSLEALAQDVVEASGDVLDFDYATVYRLSEDENGTDDAEDRTLTPVAWTEQVQETVAEPPSLGPDSLAWPAFSNTTTKYYADVTTGEETPSLGTAVRTEMYVPLGNYGLLTISSPEQDAFNAHQREIISILGANGTAALDAIAQQTELQETKRRLELVLEGTDTGLWEWTIGTDNIEWNETVQRKLGLKPGSFEGSYEAFADRVHPDDLPRVEEALTQAVETDAEYDAQFRMVHEDGHIVWVECPGVIVKQQDESDRMISLFRDITERKEYERKLKESEEQLTEQNTALESFVEIVTDAERTVDQQITDLLDLETTFLDLDVGILSEIDGSEYMIRNIIDPTESIKPGDTFDLTDTYCSLVYDTDGPVSFHSASEGGVKDHPAYKKQGVKSYIGVPVFVDDQRYGTLNFSQPEAREGAITGIEESFVRIMAQWIGTALTRQQRQEELEQISRFLQETQEVAEVGGWEVSLPSEKLRWSDQVYRIHGLPLDASLTPEESIGFYHPDDRDTIRDAFDRVTADSEPYDLELRIVTADDEVRWVRTRGEPLYEEGEIVAVHGTFQDITERKEYERKIEEQRDNLELLNQVVRHDIRNNLQVIRARADLLEEYVDESGQEHIDTVQKSTEGAIQLTKTTRDLNETMLSTEADVKPVRLDQHLDSVIENARSEFDDAIITVEDSIPNSIVPGNELLEAVFRNLVQNAVVHNDKKTPQVYLSVTIADETLTVAVVDNGPGIPDNQKEEIFGKGEKGLDSPGTGIGLYLVQTLVDQYGGNVWVEDNEPDGSVFMVELPIADAEQD